MRCSRCSWEDLSLSGFANDARLPPTWVSGRHKFCVIAASFWDSLWRLASTRQQPRSSADRFVARPALLERLSAAAPGTVTLVCAPAGSGKTVLLRTWAAETDEAVAWVSVERAEGDAQRFWLDLIDALADAAGDEVIERVSPAPSFTGAVVVERLLAQLQRLEQPLVLVIDDLHELDSEDALGWLEMLLDAATATAAGRARDTRGAGARPAPPEARGRADRIARRPTCASRSTKAAPCSGRAASRCRMPVWARCTNAPRDGRRVCAWRRSR